MKVLLNKCYGGFGVSEKAYRLYAEKKGIDLYLYKWIDGKTYRRVEHETEGVTGYFTKDFGAEVNFKDEDWDYHLYLDCGSREDPVLIECVEELGNEANGRFASLAVVEIPDGLDYVIDDYDGIETLHERVQEW